MPAHKHAELIKKWADDPSQQVWYWSGYSEQWMQATQPFVWSGSVSYAVGDKPTKKPPRETCVMAGVEFQAPLIETPIYGSEYHYVTLGNGVQSVRWTGDRNDHARLDAGTVHLSYDAAAAHNEALRAANNAAIDGAE